MKKFTKSEFLKLMRYPAEWTELDMYPDELFEYQSRGYERGNEQASEHDRNGAFHWWLKRNPSREQLKKLVKLICVDPYPAMARDVRSYILKAENCDAEVRQMLKEASG